MGDAHAAMGDGEIMGTGVEMAARVEIRVDLVKNVNLQWPRAETRDELITIVATGPRRELRIAIVEAYLQLVNWIMGEYYMEFLEAFLLVGQAGQVRVGNTWTVAAEIPKSVLPSS